MSIAVDASGNVFVTDYSNFRIQVFNSFGIFLRKWGSYGIDDGQFGSPRGVAVDSSGNVYVVDTYDYKTYTRNRRVQVFSSSGVFLRKWGSYGNDDGQFSQPYGVAVDASGKVFVTDFTCIQAFTSSAHS